MSVVPWGRPSGAESSAGSVRRAKNPSEGDLWTECLSWRSSRIMVLRLQQFNTVNGKLIGNTLGEPYAVERGAIRHIQVHGDYEAFKCFAMIADEAGCGVAAVPAGCVKLLPAETLRTRDSQERWF